jgi:hypothetical protein
LHEFAAAQQGDRQALQRLLRQADKRRDCSSVSAATKKKIVSKRGVAAGGEK